MPGISKKYMWVDITTDRRDALGSFAISAVASDGVDMARSLVSVPTQPKPSRYGIDPTLLRGKPPVASRDSQRAMDANWL